MNKMKLLSLIILIIIMCTGCTAEYNIKITRDSIEETINVNDNITSNRSSVDILKHYDMWYPTYVNYIKDDETIELTDFTQKANNVEYYDKSIIENGYGYSYTYKYNHDIENYYDTYILARTFLETTIQKIDNSLVLKTSKKNFLCDYTYFDEVKVNITIDPEVYQLNYTNTSNVNNNTYTWILNRNNCNNSEIVLTLNTINKFYEVNDNENNNITVREESKYILYIFAGIIVIIILIAYFIFKKMKEKNENIDLDD